MAKKSQSMKTELPSVAVSARETEIMATYLVKNPDQVAGFIKERRWLELAAYADYLLTDVPRSIAQTDPALFRVLRNGVTTALLMGYGSLDGNDLRARAAAESNKSSGKKKQKS